MRRPALIFDFGNVVAFFDYRKACEHLGRRLGITGEAFLERVRGLGFSSLVQEYERGRLTAEQFSTAVGALVGLDLTHDEFAAAWSDIFWLNEPVARLVERLKGLGYTLEYQRPARHPVPPTVRRDAGPFRSSGALLRGRPHQAGVRLLPGLRRGRRGPAVRLRLHRRPPREHRGGEVRRPIGAPLPRRTHPHR